MIDLQFLMDSSPLSLRPELAVWASIRPQLEDRGPANFARLPTGSGFDSEERQETGAAFQEEVGSPLPQCGTDGPPSLQIGTIY